MKPNKPENASPVRQIVVGLTGTIASGKSECARIFEQDFGIPVVDADKIAAKVTAPGSEGLKAVAEVFGEAYILPDGSYNRAGMGALVSTDKAALTKLNGLLHPIIGEEVTRAIAQYANSPIVVYDCPLLFETSENDRVDTVLLVTTDHQTRLERLMQRDGFTEDEANRRIAMQLGEADKIRRANTVLYNTGSLEALKSSLADFVNVLTEK